MFHAEGIRDVSVDTVAQNAGLTKRTLYYHFSSKDDLIAAYLEARDQPNLLLFQRWFAETEGSVADKVRGIFLNLARSAKHPKWKGCGFLRTSVELIQFPGHPAMIAARIHKMRVEDWLCSIFEEQQAPDEARILARQIILLLDGAFAVVLLHRDENYMLCAGEAAAQLINQRLAAPSAQNLEEAIRES
ncbi:bacterial regulatory, tetR family protein [Brucella thiophenivorans]|uniref:Bacterial regulatory, tetR family protein n=1 Tax=Brucella thiophenivorans TaxID=571255 RepID=A0A256FF04_9HYPH|nr:bacterial regulatory, tetR family protein [Brucella thiophenivorans]